MENIKLKIKYGIFDMDGLMFDTEILYVRSFEEYVSKETGMTFSRDGLCKLLGVNSADTRRMFPSLFGSKYSPEECFALSRIWTENYIKEYGLPVKPGLYELLDFLRNKGVRLAVASGTRKAKVKMYLEMADVDKYFEVVVGGDMVAHSKPDPETFNIAAELLGCKNSKDAVVFEDSRNGLLAAYNGNYNSVIVPDFLDPTTDNPDKYTVKVNSLDEAIPYFEF